MNRERDVKTGLFVSAGPRAWQVFMEKHSCVREWLKRRPVGTQAQYGRKLLHFCDVLDISPEEFLELDRFEARDVVWQFIESFIKESSSKAKNNLAALKSFYRSKDGETLPFDSRRGGKHHFNSKRRKKAALEHVPTKTEMYRIIDATNNFRDRVMFLVLFQTGIRVNALCSLKFKHVKKQLYQDETPKIPLRLRITDKIDTKLRGYSIDFYDTFLQGEAVEALKAYCDKTHRDGKEDEPLFYTKLDRAMNPTAVWETLKRSVKRAGLNPETIWVHTIRRAFKRVVRHASVDDEDFKEAIMGHVLLGSRENYFSRNNPEEIVEEYMKIDFSREIPETKVQKQSQEIERLKRETEKLRAQLAENVGLSENVEQLSRELERFKRDFKNWKKHEASA
jgi:integrase